MDSDVARGGSKWHVSRMTVRGETSEVVEDDEISAVSDDRGDEEINPNENVWLKSSVQA